MRDVVTVQKLQFIGDHLEFSGSSWPIDVCRASGGLIGSTGLLNSLKRAIQGIIWGSVIGLTKGDTRSLDYSSSGLRLGNQVQ